MQAADKKQDEMTTAVNPDNELHTADDTDTVDAIPMLREQIDALDAALIALMTERARVSHRIQTARMNAGGTRVELGRERTLMATYRAGLGAEGVGLAEAVLRVCRGNR